MRNNDSQVSLRSALSLKNQEIFDYDSGRHGHLTPMSVDDECKPVDEANRKLFRIQEATNIHVIISEMRIPSHTIRYHDLKFISSGPSAIRDPGLIF